MAKQLEDRKLQIMTSKKCSRLIPHSKACRAGLAEMEQARVPLQPQRREYLKKALRLNILQQDFEEELRSKMHRLQNFSFGHVQGLRCILNAHSGEVWMATRL